MRVLAEPVRDDFFSDDEEKAMRIQTRRVVCGLACCCTLWFVCTIIFASTFGWAFHNYMIDEDKLECASIKDAVMWTPIKVDDDTSYDFVISNGEIQYIGSSDHKCVLYWSASSNVGDPDAYGYVLAEAKDRVACIRAQTDKRFAPPLTPRKWFLHFYILYEDTSEKTYLTLMRGFYIEAYGASASDDVMLQEGRRMRQELIARCDSHQ